MHQESFLIVAHIVQNADVGIRRREGLDGCFGRAVSADDELFSPVKFAGFVGFDQIVDALCRGDSRKEHQIAVRRQIALAKDLGLLGGPTFDRGVGFRVDGRKADLDATAELFRKCGV